MSGDSQAALHPFIVMAKPVGSLCNLECSYCYYSKASNQGLAQSRMSSRLLESFIKQYIASNPGPIVSFIWHGGEPTLAGLDFFRHAVELQKQNLPPGWNCWNNLQTNGILLDDEWCSFLAEEHFDVGLSIDSTEWLHDKYRKDHKGSGTYERAAEAIRRLQSHGVQPDLLCTVNSDTVKRPIDVYRALRDFKTGWIQFIPIVRRKPGQVTVLDPSVSQVEITPDSVSGSMYGEFLCAVFDEWILHDLGRLDVQLFAETMRVHQGGSAGLCWMSPKCGRALIVEQDGGVYSCDHFVFPEYRIGDIGTSHLGELANSPTQLQFGENKRFSLPAQCRSCQWLSFCNGGCPKDRFVRSEDGENGLNYLCAGLRHFFSYTQSAISLVDSLAKRGYTPDAIMFNLRTRLAALWKGIGRNDPCPCGSGKKAKHCCWTKRPQLE